jgi:hypothetical protein
MKDVSNNQPALSQKRVQDKVSLKTDNPFLSKNEDSNNPFIDSTTNNSNPFNTAAIKLSHTTPKIQRELFTPLPTETPAPQRDLSAAQIRSAIWYNRSRYNAQNTRLIQDLVGVEATGTWNEAAIIAIASLQERYGLTKDGLVGRNLFHFLDNELQVGGVEDDNAHSLVMFQTPQSNIEPYAINIGTANPGIEGHFHIFAQFPERTNSAQWQYRQYIKGNAEVQRGDTVVNLNRYFSKLPIGRLTNDWQEDGNTDWAGANYGHRNQSGRASNPINRYENRDGSANQAAGSVYKGEDFPHFFEPNARTGDVLSLNLSFMGKIIRIRDGSTEIIQTRTWTIAGDILI